MKQLRQAAARERRAPIFWWFAVALAMGTALCWGVHHHSPHGAVLLAILLAAAWAAPLVAFVSLAAPRRAPKPAPQPGHGTFSEWMKQARLLGRVLLYYDDIPNLPFDIRQALQTAREDLRDTLKAHPLRDDLERACARIRAGVLHDLKNWLGSEYRRDIRELANAYEQAAVTGMDDDKRLLALQEAVEKAAALMTRNCMPRMLERERLACARDCAWVAMQGFAVQEGRASPVDLAEMLVIEWSDFSEPWLPARAIRRAMQRLESAPPPPLSAAGPTPAADPPVAAAAVPEDAAPDPVTESIVIRNGKRYRRVRVRKTHHHRARHRHGPSLMDILLSFGQWLRYSIRSWMLYR
jgi:hypothetical protein